MKLQVSTKIDLPARRTFSDRQAFVLWFCIHSVHLRLSCWQVFAYHPGSKKAIHTEQTVISDENLGLPLSVHSSPHLALVLDVEAVALILLKAAMTYGVATLPEELEEA